MSGIRVLHFIWSASFGGIEKVVIDLCAQQNATPEVSPSLLIGCRKGSFVDFIENSGFSYQFAGFRSGSDFRPSLFTKLKGLMSGFDVIHLHTFNPLVFLAASASKKPVVYTIHGNFNFGRKMRFSDKINQSLRKYFFNHHTDHITFNSQFTRETAYGRYGLKKTPNTIIHNGIPLKEHQKPSVPVSEADARKLQGKFVIGTSSRFAGFKRIDRLITAFTEFAKEKNDVLLLLVGDGVLRTELEHQTLSAGISEKVLFTGYRPNVRSYQMAMDVCVFPSSGEPFGLVAVETLSLGKPTLAFNDAGGMLEILLPVFAEDIAKDESAMANRLNHYYRHRFESEESAIEKRKVVASEYDISAMANGMLKIYRTALSG